MCRRHDALKCWHDLVLAEGLLRYRLSRPVIGLLEVESWTTDASDRLGAQTLHPNELCIADNDGKHVAYALVGTSLHAFRDHMEL